MRRKIFVLGVGPAQIPPLKYAREQGHHIITCDYLTEKRGHKLADEWHIFITIDKDQSTELRPSACMTAKDEFLCERGFWTTSGPGCVEASSARA